MSSQYPPTPPNPQNPQYPQYSSQPQRPLEPPGQRSYQTVPLGYGPQAPQPPQKKRMKTSTKWLLGGGIGCITIIALCSCSFVLLTLYAAANPSTVTLPTDTPYVPPTATITATPTTVVLPTATIGPHSVVQAYLDIVHTNSAALSADFGAVTTSCGNMVTADDVATCRADLVTAELATGYYSTQLLGANVPSCLTAANYKLQLSLDQVNVAIVEMITGIDTTDANEVIQGSHDMNTATATLGQANALITKAKCP